MILKKKTSKLEKTSVVMDLGSSKIAVAFFERQGTKIKLLAYSEKQTLGFKAGYITDPDQLANRIVDVVEDCEKISQRKIEGLHLSFSSEGFYTKQDEETLFLNGQVINKSHLSDLSKKVFETSNNDYYCYEIIDRSYKLDGIGELISIASPEGLYCHSLGLTAMKYMIKKSISINLETLFSQLSIKLYSLHDSSKVASSIILNEEEKELGAIAIDIGAVSTNIHLFLDHLCLSSKFISMGGEDITYDLARGLSVSKKEAERIKCLEGSCVFNQKDFSQLIDYKQLASEHFNNDQITQPVTKGELHKIILARLDEIFEQISYYLSKVRNPAALSRSVVITGDCANLVGLEERANSYLSRQVRILTRISYQNQSLPTSIYGLIQTISNKDQKFFWPKEQSRGIFDGISRFLRFN